MSLVRHSLFATATAVSTFATASAEAALHQIASASPVDNNTAGFSQALVLLLMFLVPTGIGLYLQDRCKQRQSPRP